MVNSKKRILLAGLFVSLLTIFALAGCSSGSTAGSSSNASSSHSAASSASESSEAEDGTTGKTHDLISRAEEAYDNLEETITDELEDRQNATPTHAKVGEEVEVTDNLAVKVVSVEPGPYDYADRTETMKVTVEMRNLTDKTLMVKPSNFDADNTNGQRVDHKIYIKDENGKRDTRSFEPTNISPNATFTGVVYFDGSGLDSVIYEPHWLVSSQNQYIYFDAK